LCFHSFLPTQWRGKSILSYFMPQTSSCISSSGNMFCLMIGNNSNPLAHIPLTVCDW
jgi:hypothetical protein